MRFFLYFTELDDDTAFLMKYFREVFLDTYYGYILIDGDCDRKYPSEIDVVYEINKLMRLHILENNIKEEYIILFTKKTKNVDMSDSFYDKEEGGYISLFPSIEYKLEFIIIKKYDFLENK
jgi:hypothetical protein